MRTPQRGVRLGLRVLPGSAAILAAGGQDARVPRAATVALSWQGLPIPLRLHPRYHPSVFASDLGGLGSLAGSFQMRSQGGEVAEGVLVVAFGLPAMGQTATQHGFVGLIDHVHEERVELERRVAVRTFGEEARVGEGGFR